MRNRNLVSKTLMVFITLSFMILLASSASATSGSLAPSFDKAGVNMTMLWFNVTNKGSTGNNLANITINQTGNASVGNITAVRLLNLSDNSTIAENTSLSSFPTILVINKSITQNTNFSIEFEISSSATNGVTIQANVTDIGNESNVSIDPYPSFNSSMTTIDTVAPVVSLNNPANDSWINSTSILFNFTPTDALSGLKNCSLYTNDTSWGINDSTTSLSDNTSNSLQGNFSADGSYVWNIECYDNAGNSAFNSSNYTIKIDTVPPTTAIKAIKSDGNKYTNNTWTDSAYVNITLNATDNGSGINSTYYCIDTSNNCVPTTLYSSTFNISANGSYYVRYYSVDNASNNESINSEVIKIDTVAPSTTNDAPSGWQNAPFIVTLNATDNLSGVSNTYYSFDNGSNTPGTSVNISTDGNHSIVYYSVDNAGNVEPTKTVYAALDTVAPNESVITDPANGATVSNVYTIKASADDATSGIKKVEFLINGVSYYNDATAPYSYNWNTSAFSDGDYFLRVIAYDYANNNYTSPTITVTVSNAPISTSSGGIIPPGTSNPSQSITYVLVNAGELVKFDFTNNKIPVDEVVITANKTIENAQIKAVSLGADKPSIIPEAPSGKVYKYLQLDTSNINGNIAQAKVKFRVEKSWFTTNGFDPSTTILNRYHNDKWEQYTATQVSSDDTYYYFEASVPGFSYFAITAKAIAVISPVKKVTGEENNTNNIIGQQAPPSNENQQKIAPGSWSVNSIALFVLFVIIVFALAYFYNSKKSKHGMKKRR